MEVLSKDLGQYVQGHRRVGGERLNLPGGINDPCGSSRRSRTVVRRIGEAIIMALLGTVIGRGCFAVGPGVDGVRRVGVVEGWGRVGRAGCVVVTRVEERSRGNDKLMDGNDSSRSQQRPRRRSFYSVTGFYCPHR